MRLRSGHGHCIRHAWGKNGTGTGGGCQHLDSETSPRTAAQSSISDAIFVHRFCEGPDAFRLLHVGGVVAVDVKDLLFISALLQYRRPELGDVATPPRGGSDLILAGSATHECLCAGTTRAYSDAIYNRPWRPRRSLPGHVHVHCRRFSKMQLTIHNCTRIQLLQQVDARSTLSTAVRVRSSTCT